MKVKELVSMISGVDTFKVYTDDMPICCVSKEDLDKDLPVLDREVCSMNFSVWDLWVDEPISELALHVK